jgi:hypothetical protein
MMFLLSVALLFTCVTLTGGRVILTGDAAKDFTGKNVVFIRFTIVEKQKLLFFFCFIFFFFFCDLFFLFLFLFLSSATVVLLLSKTC